MDSFRVFTVSSGTVTAGAVIETLHLKGAGIDISAIIVGEEGRGRERGVVPVGNPLLVPCPERGKEIWTSAEKCEKCGEVLVGERKEGSYTRNHPDEGMVQGRLMFAEIGQTKAGKPKFFSKEKGTSNDFIITVFRTKIGFRGGNNHTGDRVESYYTPDYSGRRGLEALGLDPKEKYTPEEARELAPRLMAAAYPESQEDSWLERAGFDARIIFASFPGQILAKGYIAQGAAGRMGSGEQIVALIPKDVVFRTSYSGRLYGAPGAHYYKWDGENLLAATWDERAAADIF
jgi:hypothetical protein